MSGKEDPMVNFLAVGLEKVKVEEPAAFSPQPLPDEDEKADCNTPTVEDEKPLLVYGGLRPCTAEVKADWASTGGHSPTEVEAAADKASVDAAVESATANVSEDLSEELVEMPEDYLNWLLAQTRETDPVPTLDDYSTRDPVKLKRLQEEIEWLQAVEDEFFQYQEWARNMLEKNGRVMVPKDEVSPEQFQESIIEYWYDLLKEYDNNAGNSKTEVEVAVPSD